MKRPVVIVAGIAVVIAIALTIFGSGHTSSGPKTSATGSNLKTVCNATAQVSADYNAGNSATPNNVAAADVQNDMQTLSAAAVSYGDPFLAEFGAAAQAASQGNATAMVNALNAMATSCTTLGYNQ